LRLRNKDDSDLQSFDSNANELEQLNSLSLFSGFCCALRKRFAGSYCVDASFLPNLRSRQSMTDFGNHFFDEKH